MSVTVAGLLASVPGACLALFGLAAPGPVLLQQPSAVGGGTAPAFGVETTPTPETGESQG